MHTTEPSATDHPLLARLPVAAGAVCPRALRAEDIDDFVAYRSDPEVARYQGWPPMSPAQAALRPLCDRLLAVPGGRCWRRPARA